MYRLDAIERIQGMETIVCDYLRELDDELGEDPDLPDDDLRCSTVSRDTGHQRCRREKQHAGKDCKYTRKGGMSVRFLALALALRQCHCAAQTGLTLIFRTGKDCEAAREDAD